MSIDPATLAALGATDVQARIAAGELSATDFAQALLARVDEVEPTVQALSLIHI